MDLQQPNKENITMISEEYKYGIEIGSETIEKEYKVINMNAAGCGIDFNDDELIEEVFLKGKWLNIFNKSLRKNLKFFLLNRLNKVIAGFLDHQSETNVGELYLGVNDEGKVLGIPYQDEIPYGFINNMINKVLDSKLIKTNTKFNIKKCVTWEIIELDTKDVNTRNRKLTLEKFEKIKRTYTSKRNSYNKEFTSWRIKNTNCDGKLNEILNDKNMRKKIIKYIMENDPLQKDVIKLLNSNYKFRPIEFKTLEKFKYDPKSHWYWVVQWKDHMKQYVKTIKPTKPNLFHCNRYALTEIITIDNMVEAWIRNNKNIKLFMIKFNFIKPDNVKFLYWDNNKEMYLSCYRTTCANENPCCLPY